MAVIRLPSIEGLSEYDFYDMLDRASPQDIADTANAFMADSGNFGLNELRNFNTYLSQPTVSQDVLNNPTVKAFQDRYNKAYSGPEAGKVDYFPAVKGFQAWNPDMSFGEVLGEFAKVAAMPAAGYALGPSGLGLQTGVGSQALGTGQFAAGSGTVGAGATTFPVAAQTPMTHTALPAPGMDAYTMSQLDAELAGLTGGTPLTAGVPPAAGGAAPVIEAGTAAAPFSQPGITDAMNSYASGVTSMDIGDFINRWGPTLLNVGGSVVSGYLGNKAAGEASDTSKEATQLIVDEQKRQFNTTRRDTAPYRRVGRQSLRRMRDILFNNDLSAGEIMRQSPGYGFRRKQGEQAIERNNAASGRRLSPAAVRDLTKFNSDYASDEFGKYFNRLTTMAGYGPQANNTSATMGANTAANIGNAYTNNATNQINATTNGYSSINDAIQGGIQNQLYYNTMRDRYGSI